MIYKSVADPSMTQMVDFHGQKVYTTPTQNIVLAKLMFAN